MSPSRRTTLTLMEWMLLDGIWSCPRLWSGRYATLFATQG